MHVAAVAIFAALPVAVTTQQTEIKKRYDTTLLAPPTLTEAPLPPVPKVILPPKPQLDRQLALPLPTPAPEPPVMAEIRKPDLPVPVAQPRVELPAQPGPLGPPAPKATVKTNVFSAGSSAPPTVNLPARDVQTGGFGDPNGIAAEAIPGKQGNMARVGSFDLPAGPGYGNGTGGARGVRGIVASAGFGNGVAVNGSNGTGGRGPGGGGQGHLQASGFGDVQPVTQNAAPRPREAAPTTTPLEILSKPKPEYTEEARRQRIEGAVTLEVMFAASSELRVLRVVRGLGYGLDENAVRAAQQVRFKPATRDGRPIDSTARIQVIFQLAY